jgi:hypothetical protein
MLYKKTIVLENTKKNKQMPCGQNVELLEVKLWCVNTGP